ncbi:MAG TPA: TIGR03067 domain-containing protein [Gemmata sp.]
MKAFALALGLVACSVLTARGADEKLDLAGTYKLVAGKKNGTAADDVAKKAEYTVTADTFTIKGGEFKFVISYSLDTKSTPAHIDMEIREGPEGSKGAKAVGIVELKDGTLKIAYSLDKEKRPKDFDGKTGYYFELKKEKAK